MYLTHSGTIVHIDAAFGISEDGDLHLPSLPEGVRGMNYAPGWLRQQSPDVRTAMGFTELPEPPRFDERYFFAPGVPRPVSDVRGMLLADLAAVRYEAETSGIVFRGRAYGTSRTSQQMAMAARALAKDSPGFTAQWKVGSGEFTTLSAPDIIALSDAMISHVQTCFAREAALSAQIAAAAGVLDLLAIDLRTGWPPVPTAP